MSRETEQSYENSFSQNQQNSADSIDSKLIFSVFQDQKYSSPISNVEKANSNSGSLSTLPELNIFDDKSSDKSSTDWSKFGSKSDLSSPISDAPYYIELPSKTMPYSVIGSAKEQFGAPINKKLEMPPAEAGAKVDFTLVREKDTYCLTAKSGDKQWVLKDGVFQTYWKQTK